jgi:hypothetical protein
MRPYRNTRLTEGPDVADIRCEGRRTGVGGKDYFKGRREKKAANRRQLKRADRQKEKLDE